MATKSSNEKGNPYHDEGNGQFTSPDKAGEADSSPVVFKNSVEGDKKIQAKISILMKLKDITQAMNIPKLASAADIENFLPRFFSKTVCDNLLSMFGPKMSKRGYNIPDYKFETPTGCILPIWPCVFGKFRYPDNHAKLMSVEEFDRYMTDYQYDYQKRKYYRNGSVKTLEPLQLVFRGISSRSYEDKIFILDSYGQVGLKNVGIYGGGMFGTNVYTTSDKHYADGYDGSYGGSQPTSGHLMVGFLDTVGAHYMYEHQLSRIASDVYSRRDAFERKAYDAIKNHVSDDSKARSLAHSFSLALNDIGFIGIMLGLDFFMSDGHQKNILNLGRWHVAKTW